MLKIRICINWQFFDKIGHLLESPGGQGSYGSAVSVFHFPCFLPILTAPSAWLPLSPEILFLWFPLHKPQFYP